MDLTREILNHYKVVYGTEQDTPEYQDLRDAICDKIFPSPNMVLRNSMSIYLSENKELSVTDLINESIRQDHVTLKGFMTGALTSYFLEKNISKKFDDDELKKVDDYFNSLPLGQAFEAYSKISDARKDRKFLDKDNMMEKLKNLADIHKKPIMEELKNFEVKSMGTSSIQIEAPKNNGIKL